MDGGTFSLVTINSYVDFDDYDNVVKTYNDERFFYKLRKGYTKEPDIFIRKNYVTLNDEFIQVGQTEHKEFYSAENTKTDFDFDPNGYLYLKMAIRMEAREDTYERTVFSVFDYTGLIGGVFEIFEVFGGLIVGYFIKNWFMFDILSNLYQVQKKVGSENNEERPTGSNDNRAEVHDIEEDQEVSESLPVPLDERLIQITEDGPLKEQLKEQSDEEELKEQAKDENLKELVKYDSSKELMKHKNLKEQSEDKKLNDHLEDNKSEESKRKLSDEQNSGGELEDCNSEGDINNLRLTLQRKNCIRNFSFDSRRSNVQLRANDEDVNNKNEENNAKLKAKLENRHRYGFSWRDYLLDALCISK